MWNKNSNFSCQQKKVNELMKVQVSFQIDYYVNSSINVRIWKARSHSVVIELGHKVQKLIANKSSEINHHIYTKI